MWILSVVQGISGSKEKCEIYNTDVYVKRGAILQKNDSSSSINSSNNDINDTYSAGMEKGGV